MRKYCKFYVKYDLKTYNICATLWKTLLQTTQHLLTKNIFKTLIVLHSSQHVIYFSLNM